MEAKQKERHNPQQQQHQEQDLQQAPSATSRRVTRQMSQQQQQQNLQQHSNTPLRANRAPTLKRKSEQVASTVRIGDPDDSPRPKESEVSLEPARKSYRSVSDGTPIELLFLHVGHRVSGKIIVHACDSEGHPFIIVHFMEGASPKPMHRYRVVARRTVNQVGRLARPDARTDPHPEPVQLTLHKDLDGRIEDLGLHRLVLGSGETSFNPYTSITEALGSNPSRPFHCSIAGVLIRDSTLSSAKGKWILNLKIADRSMTSVDLTLWGINQAVMGEERVNLEGRALRYGQGVGVIGLKYYPERATFSCDSKTRLILHEVSEDMSSTIRESEGMIKTHGGAVGLDDKGNEFDEGFLQSLSNISRVRKLKRHNWKESWYCNDVPAVIEVSNSEEEGPFYKVCPGCHKYSRGFDVCPYCSREIDPSSCGIILTLLAYDPESLSQDHPIPLRLKAFTETIRDYLRGSCGMSDKDARDLISSGDEFALSERLNGRKRLTICLRNKDRYGNGNTFVERELKRISSESEDGKEKE